SLNMDCENQEKDKDGNPIPTGSFNNGNTNNSIQTIDSTQALFLPIGASVSLLVMFFFFDSVQVVFTICTAGNYAAPVGSTKAPHMSNHYKALPSLFASYTLENVLKLKAISCPI
ncbi:Signal peptide peptidase-like 3, partial [Xenotaenia resolanae]